MLGSPIAWVATALALWSKYESIKVRRRAWLIGGAAQLCFAYYAVHRGETGFLPLALVNLAICVHGWRVWR